jgi:hypothetical protein
MFYATYPSMAVLAANQNGSINSTSNPETPGKIITFYGTGAGPTSPPGVTGGYAPLNASTLLALPVTVTIGGINAPVIYAGAAPGLLSGFFQINVQFTAGGDALGARPAKYFRDAAQRSPSPGRGRGCRRVRRALAQRYAGLGPGAAIVDWRGTQAPVRGVVEFEKPCQGESAWHSLCTISAKWAGEGRPRPAMRKGPFVQRRFVHFDAYRALRGSGVCESFERIVGHSVKTAREFSDSSR